MADTEAIATVPTIVEVISSGTNKVHVDKTFVSAVR